jgi:hypothetical protein
MTTANNKLKADPYTKVTKIGTWIKHHDGSYAWQITEIKSVWNFDLRTFIEQEPTVTEKTPEEMGLTRQATITVLFLKEYPSRETFDEVERVWFKMPITFTVNSSQGSNLMLKLCEKRLFVTSIDPDCLMTMQVAFESNENLTVKKGKPIRVTNEEATEIAKKTSYIFAKLMADGSFAVTV